MGHSEKSFQVLRLAVREGGREGGKEGASKFRSSHWQILKILLPTHHRRAVVIAWHTHTHTHTHTHIHHTQHSSKCPPHNTKTVPFGWMKLPAAIYREACIGARCDRGRAGSIRRLDGSGAINSDVQKKCRGSLPQDGFCEGRWCGNDYLEDDVIWYSSVSTC